MDSIAGILTKEEREELIPAVASLTEGDYRKLKSIIPELHVMRIEKHGIPEEYAFNVIRYCEMSAWIENPALIISLLKKWDDRPIFHNAIQRIKAGQPPRFHIGDRIWDPFGLAVTLPFINRMVTRRALEAFLYPLVQTVRPPGVRVLIVKGPPKSGKTFTYDYIRYTNSFVGALNFRLVFVDFQKVSDIRFGPKELAKSLLNQINPEWTLQTTLPELNTQQPARWVKQLCATIAEQIAVMNTRCIIVLDNFSTPSDKENDHAENESDRFVPVGTIDMINGLADISTGKEEDPTGRDLIRLVLLGFSHPVANYMNRIRVDDIQPLNDEDLKEYFKDYATFYKKQIPDGGLDLMLTKVHDEDHPNDPYRTENLARIALDVAEETINPGELITS